MVLRCLILLIISAVASPVYGQLDSNGFLSIDCGLPANSSYVDKETSLTYVSDEQFIDTGYTANISSSAMTDNLAKEYSTVRYFPRDKFGTRNCYTIYVTSGLKYLIRATFYYGNYDKLNKVPTFDVYLGVNLWFTVNSTSPPYSEINILSSTNYLHVCLVYNDLGDPFISSLHVRQLTKTMYPVVNATQSMITVWRYNLGASNLPLIRYPDDKYDRWWQNYSKASWVEISTSSSITLDDIEAPSLVMQTAATSLSTREPLFMNWTANRQLRYQVSLHFAEIQHISSTDKREFNITARGYLLYRNFIPPLLLSEGRGFQDTSVPEDSISLVATSNATLPPLLNAIEMYIVTPISILSTTDRDVLAIINIKKQYQIKKGWSGDPCFPTNFLWTGINCSAYQSNSTRITGLNLASSKLTGPISAYIGNLEALVSLDLSMNDLSGNLSSLQQLTALTYLDLSTNDLSGNISYLEELTALTYLDIRGNARISTILPPVLQKRQEDGSLKFWYGSINPTPSPTPVKKNVIIAIVVGALLLVILVAIAIFFGCKWSKYKRSIAPNQNESYEPSPAEQYANTPQAQNPVEQLQSTAPHQIFPNLENRKFSSDDLKKITNNFRDNIGTGGFGSVYLGHIENGVQVAVKMLSQSSTQGVREFLAEAENLARVHHKNLVSLIGYCIEKSCMALVYEYMQEGNLQDKLKDKAIPLSWKQRLQIAHESAQGLEYLHKSCNPPLIHRDVKTSNILLNVNLEAKIADFGLSRAFDRDATTIFVSSRIVGTLGYLDPEYYLSNQLSTKSDVFSFGVVLLEIITGRPPTGGGIEGFNLVQWVRLKLTEGDIESIIDPRIQDKYDLNSVWKVAALACKCTERTSSRRPAMSEVVIELKESLDLDKSMNEIHIERKGSSVSDISQNSTFEMAYMARMTATGPNVR